MVSRLLLTGGTGLVGRMLIPLLRRARPDREIIVISRRPLPDTDGIRFVACDLSRETIPLTGERIREVIHCAADIRFSLSIEEARRANADGTANILEFAARAGVEKVTHVSTVFTAGLIPGDIREVPLSPEVFANSYEQSKWEAERIVLEAGSRLPVCICRLSTIIGDSGTGQIGQHNYFHQLIRLARRSPFTVVPADAGAPIDLIPSDWAAGALAWLHGEAFQAGAIYHISAGPQRSMSVAEVFERTFRLAGRPQPGFGSLADFERETARLNGTARELAAVLRQFMPHLLVRQNFVNERARGALLGSSLTCPPLETYFDKIVSNCWRVSA